jgi:hypothetical protein
VVRGGERLPGWADDLCVATASPRRLGCRFEVAVGQELESGRGAISLEPVEAMVCPKRDVSSAPYWVTKSSSAFVGVELRCDARGAAIASCSDIPKSSRSRSVCSTVVMIIEPPGLPSAMKGRPSWRTIVGAMLERGRLPPAARLGSGRVALAGTGSKSVSSLLSRKP